MADSCAARAVWAVRGYENAEAFFIKTGMPRGSLMQKLSREPFRNAILSGVVVIPGRRYVGLHCPVTTLPRWGRTSAPFQDSHRPDTLGFVPMHGPEMAAF